MLHLYATIYTHLVSAQNQSYQLYAGILFEGCQRDWEKLPRPGLPLVVGMDGGYVRFYDRKSKKAGNFEVIAGKSIKADGAAKCFGMVYCYDTKPQRRVFEV